MVLNIFLLFWAAAAFGIAYVFIKLGEESIAPITVMAGRATIGFICLLIVSLILKKDLAGHIKDTWRFLVFGILNVVLLYLGLSFGEEETAAGIASVMGASVPFITFILVVFILKEESFSLSGIAGLIVGITGLVLVAGIEHIVGTDSTFKGVVILLSGFVSFSVGGILVQKIGKGIDPVITATYALCLAGIILWVLAFIFEQPLTTPITAENIMVELGIGVISTASALSAYFFLIKRSGPFFASISLYMVPVFGVVFSVIILGEILTRSQVLGIAIVLAGVFLINLEKFKKAS